jgi:bacteriocin biosynthesis cyclodehydratase domain-containing protein
VHRPRLKRTIETVASAAGDVYLLRPGGDGDIVVESPDDDTRALLAGLDGSSTVDQLAASFGAGAVTSALRDLGALDLLEDAADDDRIPTRELARYDRQLRYFGDLAAPGRPASEYHRRLRSSRVAILGVGGLGSWAAYALACCGVGELVLVDGDEVEESNFNRQILYRESDVGRPKVDAAVETLSGFSSLTRLTTRRLWLDGVDSVLEAIEGADFVVNAADWPAHDIERWVNAACFQAGVATITMSHAPPVARVGPMYAPGETGCFACQEATYRDEYPLFDEVVEQRRGRPSPGATLGPVCAFVGGQVALEALHRITGVQRPSTLGKARIFDLRTMELMTEEVPRRADCEVCGAAVEAA